MEIAFIDLLYGPSHIIGDEKQALSLAAAAFSVRPCDPQDRRWTTTRIKTGASLGRAGRRVQAALGTFRSSRTFIET